MNTSLEHPLNGRCNLYLFVIPRFDTLAVDGWAVTFGTASSAVNEILSSMVNLIAVTTLSLTFGLHCC